MILLFSLGSLISLGYDAFEHVAAQGLTFATAPDAISVLVSTLLVVCMDIAMLNAAGQLRMLMNRRAKRNDFTSHVFIIIAAMLLEASTYAYMAYLYDKPNATVVWVLIIARAIAAPIFGIYLSLARALPVGPRDIMYQVELQTGRGMLRDLAERTAEPGGLAVKLAMYQAAAPIPADDSHRLSNLIDVVSANTPTPTTPQLLEEPEHSNSRPVTVVPATLSTPSAPRLEYASTSGSPATPRPVRRTPAPRVDPLAARIQSMATRGVSPEKIAKVGGLNLETVLDVLHAATVAA